MRLFFLWASLSASTQQERSLSHPARSCLTWQAGQTAPDLKKDYPSCWVEALAESNPLILKDLEEDFSEGSNKYKLKNIRIGN